MLRRCALVLAWPLLLPWVVLRAVFGFVAFCFFKDSPFTPKGVPSTSSTPAHLGRLRRMD